LWYIVPSGGYDRFGGVFGLGNHGSNGSGSGSDGGSGQLGAYLSVDAVGVGSTSIDAFWVENSVV
jgi:hypothetical protein